MKASHFESCVFTNNHRQRNEKGPKKDLLLDVIPLFIAPTTGLIFMAVTTKFLKKSSG